MGYRSDVLLAVVFDKPAQADEVMAVYAMLPKVQEYDLAKDWTRHQVGDGYTVLLLERDNVKWYESYEDVQAYEYMFELVREFAENRGVDTNTENEPEVQFPYASTKIRIGEEDNDIETSRGGNDSVLEDFIFDNFGVRREIFNGLSE